MDWRHWKVDKCKQKVKKRGSKITIEYKLSFIRKGGNSSELLLLGIANWVKSEICKHKEEYRQIKRENEGLYS